MRELPWIARRAGILCTTPSVLLQVRACVCVHACVLLTPELRCSCAPVQTTTC